MHAIHVSFPRVYFFFVGAVFLLVKSVVFNYAELKWWWLNIRIFVDLRWWLNMFLWLTVYSLFRFGVKWYNFGYYSWNMLKWPTREWPKQGKKECMTSSLSKVQQLEVDPKFQENMHIFWYLQTWWFHCLLSLKLTASIPLKKKPRAKPKWKVGPNHHSF